jgi:2-dehydro-3-deoxy-D-arabinonate dehydratase
VKLAKILNDRGEPLVAIIDDGYVIPLDMRRNPKASTLSDILHSPEPEKLAKSLILPGVTYSQVNTTRFLAPLDRQEVWASGVTYKRSKVAREEESAGAAQFYDKVYSAPRPELFFKATPERVSAHNEPIRVRADGHWNVPEPELTLVVSPDLRIVGYTIGNDVSSRDIEGENPLYLPQAKVYHGSCAIGPFITLASSIADVSRCEIRLLIQRNKQVAFDGSTLFSQMNRTPKELVEWLGKENRFPNGAMLMTGTGIVPPDSFSLAIGDVVDISISGIGTLSNPVGP